LQHAAFIAKEDDTGLVRMAAQIGMDVGAHTSHLDRGGGKLRTFCAKLVNKAPCSFAATAALTDITVNLTKIAARSRCVANARHDHCFSRSASEWICSMYSATSSSVKLPPSSIALLMSARKAASVA